MEFGPILRAMTRSKVRYGLIVLEIALTLAVVTNCVSLIRDAQKELGKESGFDDANILTVRSQPFAPAFQEKGLPRELRPRGPRRPPSASGRQGGLEHALPAVAGRRELDGDAAGGEQGSLAEEPGLQRGRGHVRDARGSRRRGARLHARRGRVRGREARRALRDRPRARRGRDAEEQDHAGRRHQPGLRAPRVRRRLPARQAARGQRRRPVPRRRRHRPLLQPVRMADPRVRPLLPELLGDVRGRLRIPREDGAGRPRERPRPRREGASRRERRPQRPREDAPRGQGRVPGEPEARPRRPDGRHRPPPLRDVPRDHRAHVLLGGGADAADRDPPRARGAAGRTS